MKSLVKKNRLLPLTHFHLRPAVDIFDDTLESLFGRSFLVPRTIDFMSAIPAIDLIEKKDHFVVRAELPGVKKEDIKISATSDSISIRGETKREEKKEEGTYFCCERSYGSFSRTINLPSAIREDKIEASYKDGVLELKLPKSHEARSREIEVRVK